MEYINSVKLTQAKRHKGQESVVWKEELRSLWTVFFFAYFILFYLLVNGNSWRTFISTRKKEEKKTYQTEKELYTKKKNNRKMWTLKIYVQNKKKAKENVRVRQEKWREEKKKKATTNIKRLEFKIGKDSVLRNAWFFFFYIHLLLSSSVKLSKEFCGSKISCRKHCTTPGNELAAYM